MASRAVRVLIVDDEADMLHILTAFLTEAGYQVVQAYGGEHALRKAKANPPDLVVTDLAMPDFSGVQLIEALKSDPRTQNIPVIAATSYIWDDISQAAGSVGVDGFVGKPFTAARLLLEVQRVLSPDFVPANKVEPACPGSTLRIKTD